MADVETASMMKTPFFLTSEDMTLELVADNSMESVTCTLCMACWQMWGQHH